MQLNSVQLAGLLFISAELLWFQNVSGKIDCGRPGYRGREPPKPRGQFQNHFYPPDTVVEYESCDKFDYVLGDELRICRPDGKYTGSVPRCVKPSNKLIKSATVVNSGMEKDISVACLTNGVEHDQNCASAFLNSNNKTLQLNLNYISEILALRIYSKTQCHARVYVLEPGTRYRKPCSNETQSDNARSSTYYCNAKGNVIQIEYSVEPIFEILIYEESSKDIPCGQPDIPKNGWFSSWSNTYDCQEGYNLEGTMNNSCDKNGMWLNEAPICKNKSVQCDRDDLKTPNGGTWIIQAESIMVLQCDVGYEQYPPGKNRAQCFKGQWKPENLSCSRAIGDSSTMTVKNLTPDSSAVQTTISESEKDTNLVKFSHDAPSTTEKPETSTKLIKLTDEKLMKIIIISSVASAVTALAILACIITVVLWKRRCKRGQQNAASSRTTVTSQSSTAEDHVYNGVIYDEMTDPNTYVLTPGRKRSMPKIPDILELVYTDEQMHNRCHRISSSSDQLPGYNVHIYSEPFYSEVSCDSRPSTSIAGAEVTEEEQEDEVFKENEVYGTD